MLKPILRRLKHWALHHLGITTILDAERAIRSEIVATRQQTADTVLGLEQRFASMTQSSEERAARVAQDITQAVREQVAALQCGLSQVGGGCEQMRRNVAALEQAAARLESKVSREFSENANRMDQIVGTLGHAQGSLDQVAAWDFGSISLDRWRIQENEGLLRYLRKKDYLRPFRRDTYQFLSWKRTTPSQPRQSTRSIRAARRITIRFVCDSTGSSTTCSADAVP